jgi:hypothetical protein
MYMVMLCSRHSFVAFYDILCKSRQHAISCENFPRSHENIEIRGPLMKCDAKTHKHGNIIGAPYPSIYTCYQYITKYNYQKMKLATKNVS